MSKLSSDILRYVDPADAAGRLAELPPAEKGVLDQVNRKIAGAESLEAVLDFLFEALGHISPCDRFSLAFLEENGQRVVSHLTRAGYEPILLKKGYAADLRDSSLETIIRQGRPRIINDLVAYLAAKPESRSTRLLLSEGVRSSLTCPLMVDGRRVGFLFRSSREPNVYQDHHVDLQIAIAERLSQAVEKVYRIEQLRTANQAYFEMLSFVAHELKSPVASMVMEASLMLDGYVGQLEPKQRDRLKRMETTGHHLLALITDYLNLARIEGKELEPAFRKGVDIGQEIIEPCLQMIAGPVEQKAMKITRELPEPPPTADLDPDLIRIVLNNLLSNATKYGREKGEIRIRVQASEAHLSVSVFNEGPGFPAEQRSKLFKRFSRLDTPELTQERGTGVGLYTVWQIIQAHQGKIWAESEPGQWAEFAFRIPQPLATSAKS